jgi:hypothetical protein
MVVDDFFEVMTSWAVFFFFEKNGALYLDKTEEERKNRMMKIKIYLFIKINISLK